MQQSEPMDLELFDPNSPKVQWANACAHSIMNAYGLKTRHEWRADSVFYNRLAQRLMSLYGRGIPPHDLPKILRCEIPWPR
jgi:hypothetical protein